MALLLVFAGCASPQDETETGGQPAEAESPTTVDNEAGAEPVNPPNATNGTESGGTVNPADENESGVDGDTNETTGTETGENESANVVRPSGLVGAAGLVG